MTCEQGHLRDVLNRMRAKLTRVSVRLSHNSAESFQFAQRRGIRLAATPVLSRAVGPAFGGKKTMVHLQVNESQEDQAGQALRHAVLQ